MTETEFNALLEAVFKQNQLEIPSDPVKNRYFCFAKHLLEVNESMNLTSIRDFPGVVTKHFADSLLAARYIPANARVLDVGCGAGFPSLPLSIARNDLQVTALDSTGKKVEFVRETAELLELNNLQTVSGRAEDWELMQKLGKFDVVTSRAVARLNILAELCLPYVKIGGKMIAMKASKADEEVKEAENAIEKLGGSIKESVAVNLINEEGAPEPRTLILIDKIKPTPAAYPRAYAQIKKKPL